MGLAVDLTGKMMQLLPLYAHICGKSALSMIFDPQGKAFADTLKHEKPKHKILIKP